MFRARLESKLQTLFRKSTSNRQSGRERISLHWKQIPFASAGAALGQRGLVWHLLGKIVIKSLSVSVRSSDKGALEEAVNSLSI